MEGTWSRPGNINKFHCRAEKPSKCEVGMLLVSVLGPLRVLRDGIPVRLGPRQVEVLSILLLNRGTSVPANRMVNLLWGDGVPPGAPATLRSHVSHLRRALRPDSPAPPPSSVAPATPRAGGTGWTWLRTGSTRTGSSRSTRRPANFWVRTTPRRRPGR
ncbi:AfsR/SARP family transcriptional regulator [Plantactinospora veratri]